MLPPKTGEAGRPLATRSSSTVAAPGRCDVFAVHSHDVRNLRYLRRLGHWHCRRCGAEHLSSWEPRVAPETEHVLPVRRTDPGSGEIVNYCPGCTTPLHWVRQPDPEGGWLWACCGLTVRKSRISKGWWLIYRGGDLVDGGHPTAARAREEAEQHCPPT